MMTSRNTVRPALVVGAGLFAMAWGLEQGLAALPVEPGPGPDVEMPVEVETASRGSLAEKLKVLAPELNPEVLDLALRAVDNARARGITPASDVLSVIDFSLHSATPRLWVFDTSGEPSLLYHELVSHGSGSGAAEATDFSNRVGSRQTSLGLFLTAETYYGRNGYSLRIHGLEDDFNDNVYPRAVVIHGAWYVSEEFAKKHGRIGRSWGCPAVRDEIARPLIDAIKEGSFLFAYYPQQEWLEGSEFLAAPAE